MSSTSSVIGIDLGGTKLRITRLDTKTMKVLKSEKIPTRAQSFSLVKEDLVEAINNLRAPDTVAVGIGVPGLIDRKSGTIMTLPNIAGAEKQHLSKYLTEKTGLPTFMENDSHCFALGEALYGAGKGHDIVIGVIMGTGVGSGIIIHQNIFHGAHGFAGELGHMLLVPGQPPFDTADKRGEVEQFLSGKAMGLRCEAATSPKDFLSGQTCSFMHPELYKEVAWLVTNLTYCLDPSIIVFGGSAGTALKDHLPAIQTEMKKWMLPTTPIPPLAVALLDDSPVRGAASVALKALGMVG
ncbi:MAG: ROK family protein [Candidatus Peribacteraceae bacterium]|nr:ROK family protein [Candidatus Peribacteraceae bacterium]